MATPGATLVSSFASLKPLLRRIVLRVHPDVVSHLPQAHAAQNATSLQVLFRLFDGLRARLPEGAPPPPPPPLQPLSERHQLDFWYEPRSADAGAALEPRLLQREVRLPLGLEARCARLVGSGHSAAAAALWLGVGTGALADLGEGLGLHAASAGVAGLAATAASSPFDNAKTMFYTHATGRGLTVAGVLRGLVVRGGPRALFRGFWPAWARLGVHTLVTLSSLEALRCSLGFAPL